MKIYLADTGWYKQWEKINFWNFKRLVSFVYISEDEAKNLNLYNDYILDSGAFTYLNQAKGNVDWDNYIENYAKFINSEDWESATPKIL